MASLTAAHRAELAGQGWTVVRGFIDGALAAKAIDLVDDLLGREGPVEAIAPERYQPGPWPEGEPLRGTGSRLPVVATGNFRHSMLHPIHSPLTAELLEPFVELNTKLLDCPPERLKLMQQMFVRTDASPPPHPGHGGVPPAGWHHGARWLSPRGRPTPPHPTPPLFRAHP